MIEAGYKKGKVILLALGHLSTDIYPGFLAPIIPLLMKKFDFSITMAAMLGSTLAFSSSLMQPLFGYLSDKMKKVYFLVLGPIVAAFFMSFIDMPNNYYMLLLFLFLSGLGVAAFHPQAAALTNIKSGNKKSAGMGLFVLGGSFGVALGALLISAIVSIGGLSSTYYAVFPGFVIAGFLYKYFHNVEIVKSTEKNNNYSTRTVSYIIVILILLAVIRAVIILGLSTFIPLYLAEKGQNIAFGGITLFLMNGFGGLGGFAGGYFSEKIGEKNVILLSFLIPIPLFYLYLTSSGMITLVFFSLAAFFLYSGIPVVISLGQDTLPHKINMVSSMMMGFCWGAAGLILIGLGAIAEIIGIEDMLYYLVYSIGLGLLLGLFLLKVKFNNNNQ